LIRKDCSKFGSLITGYVDRELDKSDRKNVKTHLADCPNCKQDYLDELKIKRTVKERLPIYETPVSLQRRIRRQIARSEAKPGFWQLLHPIFVYRPLAASVSMAIIAFLMFVPIYQEFGYQNDALSTSRDVELSGQIVCLDCDVFSKDNIESAVHRAGIMTEDQRIWTFVNASKLSDVLHRENLTGRKARVSGDLFPGARYIYVKKYELL